MWSCYEAIKICLNSSRAMLANQRVLKLKDGVYKVKFKFFLHRNYSSMYFSKYPKHQLIQYYYLQSKRKNHFETRSQKLIFKPVTEKKGKELSHSCIIESLQSCRSVEEQIEIFHTMVKLPDDDIKLRQSICSDLEKALQSYFPSVAVDVCLIGSSINGFGFKGCDVDLSLQFLSANVNEHGKKSLSSDEEEEAAAVSKLYKTKNHLLTVRKILQEAKFKEPLTVIPGRCPILNFSHRNLACDLSVNNRLAQHSTHLMLLCGKLDDRVTPLLQVVIYWAKQCRLVGGPGKFKTYAIFLMVIYFLQTRNPPVLPSVQTMFAKTEFLEHPDNWSYDVTKHLSRFERSANAQSVEELLREFFTFYGNYDFSHVICPFSGCSHERKRFVEKFDCDDSFVMNTVCIQDPLNLSWNVTTGVNWKHCKNFIKAVIVVWEKCLDLRSWSPQSGKWGLSALLDPIYSPHNLVNVKEFALCFPHSDFERSAQDIRHILNECLDFECHDVTHPGLPQNVRNALRNTETDETPSLGRWVFEASDTWLGRSTYALTSDSNGDVWSRERHISDMVQRERRNKEKESFLFLCECRSEDGRCLLVRFRPLSSDRFIPKLAIFLKEYIAKLMECREKECQY